MNKILLTITLMLCSVNLQATEKQEALATSEDVELGTPEKPVIISLLPERLAGDVDADNLPLPDFLRPKQQQPEFKLQLSESYKQSVDDFCLGRTHIAVLSMITYAALEKRCRGYELLAIEILEGKSVYHAGLFTHRKNFQRNNRYLSFHTLENKSIAFGSRYSTTAFHYPLKFMLDMDVMLPDELNEIYITGSHTASINKLVNGEVELAAASFQSWKAAIDNGTVNPMLYMPLLKSGSIPLPPIVMRRDLPDKLKVQIRRIFKDAHTITDNDAMTGLRGTTINRYDVDTVQEESYLASLSGFEALDLSLIERILDKAIIDETE
ncbi:MAG: PhnD/SsuA/transferrin family substrate-binding protein [Thiolinea sp.]